MKVTSLLILLVMVGLASCVSLNESGRLYFQKGDRVKGVEPMHSLFDRLEKDRPLRDLMYGQIKSSKIAQCTILRNQLYVAAMNSHDKQLQEIVMIMEPAYQDSVDKFLQACDQIIATKLGKSFLALQQEYVISNK